MVPAAEWTSGQLEARKASGIEQNCFLTIAGIWVSPDSIGRLVARRQHVVALISRRRLAGASGVRYVARPLGTLLRRAVAGSRVHDVCQGNGLVGFFSCTRNLADLSRGAPHLQRKQKSPSLGGIETGDKGGQVRLSEITRHGGSLRHVVPRSRQASKVVRRTGDLVGCRRNILMSLVAVAQGGEMRRRLVAGRSDNTSYL